MAKSQRPVGMDKLSSSDGSWLMCEVAHVSIKEWETHPFSFFL